MTQDDFLELCDKLGIYQVVDVPGLYRVGDYYVGYDEVECVKTRVEQELKKKDVQVVHVSLGKDHAMKVFKLA